MRLLSLLLVVCSLAAAQTAPAAPKSAHDKAALEAYVRHYLLWDSRIQVEVLDPKPSADLPGFQEVTLRGRYQQATQDVLLYVSKDGQKLIQGTVFDVQKSPFAADLAKLNTASAPSFGAPGAPVSLVIFSDFQCSFCREEAKIIRDNVAKAYPTQARVYFKDFPLEPIHPWAKPAAIAGRCVFRQGPSAFWAFHDWAFENQPSITADNLKAKVLEWAGTSKLDTLQLTQCLDTQATKAEVEASIGESLALGLNSTPTTFINGRRIARQIPWAEMKAVIDFELEHLKKSGGEAACCEVTLPVPGKK